ncbi:hydrogenase large subunit [Pelotalea chapellei]|uniref:NADH-quinone oxidoreductase subunit C n=1 Tax=Pelotalea chapellei TaxID=44671 RepID=A0ABS5U8N0_9BACT|nr:NADH-quinone oxidoreductase subunit C [Pelotalea chapellei]MBT1072026.1 NADH-quinone oxidoreductase subunit C [Pelotalea chapellei]
MRSSFYTLNNGSAVPRRDIPDLDRNDFLQLILDALDHGWRASSYFSLHHGDGCQLYCVLTAPAGLELGIISTTVTDGTLPSLSTLCPQLHMFEREIAEQFGLAIEDHPWMKPVRFQRPMERQGCSGPTGMTPGVTDFYQVQGAQVHEVAVGPVHAGIIEPGHFRFQCHGEEVFHLEICLGYQHRGLEQMLLNGPHPLTMRQMEAIAGDTTIGHGLAHVMTLEALSGCAVSDRAHALRGIALELERLANHTGDMGAIAGDVAFLPTSSFCGRIRGDFLNMTAELCGSRFGRGFLVPGGIGFDCSAGQAESLLSRLATARKDLGNAIELLWNTPSATGRLENTGTLSKETARELGLVGPAARACGLERDVRRDLPFGIYATQPIPMVCASTGDVHARTLVRRLEIEASLDYLEKCLADLPDGNLHLQPAGLAPDHLAVALTEGWRGEICHVAVTDSRGKFGRYKITDPSFHNWTGLAMALRGQQISDFPLCNKSFNLSYCGFDL